MLGTQAAAGHLIPGLMPCANIIIILQTMHPQVRGLHTGSCRSSNPRSYTQYHTYYHIKITDQLRVRGLGTQAAAGHLIPGVTLCKNYSIVTLQQRLVAATAQHPPPSF
jgi:hypothetical protein